MLFRLASRLLFVNSSLLAKLSRAAIPSLCTPSLVRVAVVKSRLCSCSGTGFSSPASNFACLRSCFARVFFVMLVTSTPTPTVAPSAVFDDESESSKVHSQAGYSSSSFARRGVVALALVYDRPLNSRPPGTLERSLTGFIWLLEDCFFLDDGFSFSKGIVEASAVDGKKGSLNAWDLPGVALDVAAGGVLAVLVDGGGEAGGALGVAGTVATVLRRG